MDFRLPFPPPLPTALDPAAAAALLGATTLPILRYRPHVLPVLAAGKIVDIAPGEVVVLHTQPAEAHTLVRRLVIPKRIAQQIVVRRIIGGREIVLGHPLEGILFVPSYAGCANRLVRFELKTAETATIEIGLPEDAAEGVALCNILFLTHEGRP